MWRPEAKVINLLDSGTAWINRAFSGPGAKSDGPPEINFRTPDVTKADMDIETISEIARDSTYGYKQVRFLSNNIGPRLSGSPQAEAAVSYVAQQMRGASDSSPLGTRERVRRSHKL